MAKLMTIEEANEIIRGMCEEWGASPIHLELQWDRHQESNMVVGVQTVTCHHTGILKFFIKTSTLKRQLFVVSYIEDAVSEVKQRFSRMQDRADRVEQMRQTYATFLIDKELKK